MLPPNRNIFRSRWKAMLWAAFVCIGALQFAGGSEKGGDQPETPKGLKDAADALNLP